MRALSLLFLLCSTFAYASVDVRDGKVTADLNSQPLQSVIDILRQQTQITISLQEGIGNQMISAHFENVPIATAIRKMLEGTGINFVVLGNDNGKPESIFIGNSEKPGAAPRKIDNRPTQNRGVVTPVAPYTPPESVPPPQQSEESQRLRKKDEGAGVNVPTGGGYVPQGEKPPQQENQQEEPEQPPQEEPVEEQ